MTLFARAGDIVILGNVQLMVIQTTNKLIESSKEIGLIFNETEIEYTVMSRNLEDMNDLKVGQFVFERVEDFENLRVNINSRIKIHNKVK